MLRQMASRHLIPLLLGSAVVGAHSSPAQENRSVMPKTGFVTPPDGIKIHYIEAGPAEKVASSPALLFVPGWAMPADILGYQIRYFSKRHRGGAMVARAICAFFTNTRRHHPTTHAPRCP